jgi:arylsulfatase A
LKLVSLPLLFLACATAQPLAARTVEAEAPNVVLFFCDDLAWGDVGCNAPDALEPLPFSVTPHIDRLADEGVRFTDFYVSQPVCSASRASLLTGCYANRVGIHGALGPQALHGLHPDETTLAELARDAGLATGIFGKWHLGNREEFLPTRHGFDRWVGIPYSNDMWPYHPEWVKPWEPLPLYRDESIVSLSADQRWLTTGLVDEALAFIDAAHGAGRGFFAYVAHPLPHVPLHVGAAQRGSTGFGLLADVLAEIDHGVGRVLAHLEALGLREDTLLIFLSDNGPWLSYGDHAGSTGGLREGKGTTWEGGVRVPAIASWPGRIPAGRVCREPVMTIDVLPTLARLWNVAPGPLEIDGRDAWPLFAGEPGARSPQEAYFFWYHRSHLEAVRSGPWKLHLPHAYRSMGERDPGAGGSPGQYDYGVRTELALYHLGADPGETRDVAAEHPQVVAELLERVQAMREELGDELTGIEGRSAREPGRTTVPFEAFDAQDPESLPSTVEDLLAALGSIARIGDDARRAARLDELLGAMESVQRLPVANRDGRALFLFQGKAESVELAGDHTGWSPVTMETWPKLDLWLRIERLHPAARLDYKLIVDGEWVLDPLNERVQWSGFGPNSVLSLPAWRDGRRPRTTDAERGALHPPQPYSHASLDYALDVAVYEPPGLDRLSAAERAALPWLIVTDGHEYLEPELGGLAQTADALLESGAIEPLRIAFVDPRVAGHNRRADHLIHHAGFADYLADGLLPQLRQRYGGSEDPRRTGLLGTSLGGLHAAWMALARPDAFRFHGCQSPAFEHGDNDLAQQLARVDLREHRLHLSAGDLHDGLETTLEVIDTLREAERPPSLAFRATREGHSWGQWAGLVDEVLIDFSRWARDADWPSGAALLDDLRWDRRLLVVQTPPSDARRTVQAEAMRARTLECLERDLILVQLVGEELLSFAGSTYYALDLAPLRERLELPPGGEFAVRLVGKDGTVKLRSDEPLDLDEVLLAIDAMPMRRAELERDAAERGAAQGDEVQGDEAQGDARGGRR